MGITGDGIKPFTGIQDRIDVHGPRELTVIDQVGTDDAMGQALELELTARGSSTAGPCTKPCATAVGLRRIRAVCSDAAGPGGVAWIPVAVASITQVGSVAIRFGRD